MRKLFCLALVFFFFIPVVLGQQAQPDPGQWLRSGPMLGYSDLTETVVWLQTRRPVRAQIRFWKQGKPETARLSAEVRTTAETDHIARFTLSQLEFGTKYDYEVYLDGLKVSRSYPMTFQSQPMWKWRGEPESTPPTFKFAVGSCAYINDAPYDRPGKPYGGDMEIFTAIANTRPDFMLWLGDNVYYREGDWGTENGMRYRYAQNRELPELQALFAATHNYAIWDDHDYGSNDSDRTFRGKDLSLTVFQDYWANPGYGTRETPGVFGRFEWGDVEFFMLDDRYHRSPNAFAKTPGAVMFGDAQMRWLMESLADSEATFKIVLGGNQMLNPMCPFECWGEFPGEQKKFLDFIREAKITGVLCVTGDRHLTELIKRKEPGIYPLYDFTTSPLTSGMAKPKPEEEKNPSRVPGTYVTDARNFGLIEATGPKGDRKLVLHTIDKDGKERWKVEISEKELRFAK